VEAAGGSFVARQPVSTPIPLTRTLKKAIVHKGFSFVEVLSPCPTQFGRRNAFRSPQDMLVSLKNTCVTLEKAKSMAPDEVKEKILVGEFVGGKGGEA
jgi:2-oxoglutarate ferredoxin oxidoreductase subunit beta